MGFIWWVVTKFGLLGKWFLKSSVMHITNAVDNKKPCPQLGKVYMFPVED